MFQDIAEESLGYLTGSGLLYSADIVTLLDAATCQLSELFHVGGLLVTDITPHGPARYTTSRRVHALSVVTFNVQDG